MLRDVFYYGSKPNVHPREQYAESFDDARKKCTTEHFWIINEFCDYRGFDWDWDFEFLPDEDVWAEQHTNIWPSQHQKDSGTWLCSCEEYDLTLLIYRGDVNVVKRKNIKTSNWVELDTVDPMKFDFSWHPDPTDPPYIYKWGSKFAPVQLKTCLAYHVEGATEVKYMTSIVELLPQTDRWIEHQAIDKTKFDMSWRPDPMDPPLNYVWGNKYIDGILKPTLEYRVPDAVDTKYMPDLVPVLPEYDRWEIPKNLNTENFDFSWRPDPREPDFIYEFATQWQKSGGPRYVMPGATEIKYLDNKQVTRLSSDKNWTIPSNVDATGFDFSWHPDDTDPPYIYVFATQWAFSGGPAYTVDGATEIKYIDDQIAIATADKTNWEYDSNTIDAETFDFSWHPYVEDEPYIYQFGTQWQKTGGPRYITPGCASDAPVKYIDPRIIKATRLPNNQHMFNTVKGLTVKDFDYSWHPDETEEPFVYIFGNQWYPAEVMPTLKYKVRGAKKIKYISNAIATLAPDIKNWVVPEHIDTDNFDFSWHPEPKSPKLIFEFATQWQKSGGPRYVMPGATSIKYMDIIKATKLPDKTNWTVTPSIDSEKFDFSWHPDAASPPYVYVFATQWAFSGGPVYTVPGATEIKYIDDQTATSKVDMSNWEYDPNLIDKDSFDFSWHPYIEDQPYIYQFGTQWQKTGGPRYVTPGSDDTSPIKYVDTRIIKARRLPDRSLFTKLGTFKIKDFDHSWHPDDTAPPYNYQFGSNWYPVEDMPVIEYNMEGATEVKLVFDNQATLGRNLTNWNFEEGIDVTDFDFSWLPHPHAPPYIYQFGTRLDNSDGPTYVTPNNNGEIVYLPRLTVKVEEETVDNIVIGKYYIETTLDALVNEHPNELFWAMRKNIDYSSFDFDWRPDTIEIAWELDFVHVFGSPESELTQTYFVSSKNYIAGNISLKFVEEDTKLDDKTLFKLFKKSDMFYVDRGNQEAQSRFDALKALYPQIQKTRYLNSWVDTINRCTNRSTTDLFWVLNSELDYNGFDFEYYPNPWQMKMVHVFGTQWSHWGTTFMVNRESFSEDTKYVKIIEHLSNINFVKNIKAKATQCVYDTFVINHDNIELERIVEQITSKTSGKNVTVVKYNTSYLQTLKDIVTRLPEKKEHYLWLCSSVCDYSTFDFSYTVDPFARDNLHVFPSGKQKFGDTFFIDVNKTKEIIDDMLLLEDYHKVNYNGTMKANRLPEPIIVTSNDTLISAAINIEGFPYATIISSDNKNISVIENEPMNLWSPETKNILVTSTGATRITVPREVKDHVKKELYDYPYIKKASKLAISSPLDIVYLSNGETGAEENWEHLQKITKGLKNRVVRVDGVNGRVQAYHAALEASETPWAFTVFAKLKISPKFDFNWQPDRMQVAKHYVFHAKNPVNGLIYGHQAMIAYNKKLTLANKGSGLDFTLDDEHEVVPLLSGVANYNTDEFSTWRTAFREVLKLKAEDSEISRTRLDAWLNKATGDYFQYSIKGAIDADEYYDEVDGDFEMLKLSYEWAWLKERFANS